MGGRTMLRRRLALFVVVPLLALAAPAPNAHAHTNACASIVGSMSISHGFGLPGLTFQTGLFGLMLDQPCLAGLEYARGSIAGSCGLASGSGVTESGHAFVLNILGEQFHIYGDGFEAAGLITESPSELGRCADKTAHGFLVKGVAVLHHEGAGGG